jgi:(1->4)-alpha-D-glucan 1-alpha-D-glucosylmutase
VKNKEDGRIKLYLTWRALHCCREHPGLFTAGEYVPLGVRGESADHVFAFLRRRDEQWAIAAAPRLLARLLPDNKALPLGKDVWHESALVLPGVRPAQRLRNIFTGEILETREQDGQTILPLAEVFAHFPVALLLAIG